jgi:glycosyltransferase involved in cell wall biosynthesis
VAKDDPVALADAAARVLADPALAARLVAEGRAEHDRHYSEAAVVGRYLDFFRRIAA